MISKTEPIDGRGEFWTPEKPKARIGATFSFSEESGAHIALFGQVAPKRRSPVPVLFGHTTVGDVTLFNLMELRRGSNSAVLHAGSVLCGAHVPSESDLYQEQYLELESLEDWYDQHPFTLKPWLPRRSAKASYSKPRKRRYSVGPLGAQVTLDSDVSATYGTNTSVALSHVTRIHVKPEVPQPLSWFLDAAVRLREFMSVVYGLPARVDAFRLLWQPASGRPAPVTYLTRIVQPSAGDAPSYHELMLRFPMIEAEFGRALRRWFKDRALRPVHQALSNPSFSHGGTYDATRFLAFAQAIEGFHRATEAGTFTSAKRWAPIRTALVDAIPDGIPREHREALVRRVGYGNEVTLRQRLKQLLKPVYRGVLETYMPDPKKFAGDVVAARNALTHPATSDPSFIWRDGFLIHATEQLRLALLVLLQFRLGFSRRAVVEGLGSHPSSVGLYYRMKESR